LVPEFYPKSILYNFGGKKDDLKIKKSGKLTSIRFLGSFFIVALTTVGSANPHQPAKFVFATFLNQTGWDNSFVVFMNGLVITAGVSSCLLELMAFWH